MQSGSLEKMGVSLRGAQVEYSLKLSSHTIALNPYLGKTITLEFTAVKNCIHCGISVKKTFQQGYCFPCTQKLAACDLCILKPHLCHFHLNTCREPDWAQTHCMQDHIVYLANTSALKVGITRQTQVPTRFIDQGAVQALPIFRVKTRRIAGIIEKIMTQELKDVTNWRVMLKGQPVDMNLKAEQAQWLERFQSEVQAVHQQFGPESVHILDEAVIPIEYPVLIYPPKVQTLDFEKTPKITAELLGIKGQYLIFDQGVLNIRKFTGYHVSFNQQAASGMSSLPSTPK